MMRGTPADREEALRLPKKSLPAGTSAWKKNMPIFSLTNILRLNCCLPNTPTVPEAGPTTCKGCSNCSVPVNTEPKRIHRTMICQNITPSWTIRQVNAIPPVWIVSSCPRGKTKPLYGKNFTTCRKKPYPCTTCV